jgi:hypothetical protein
MVVFVVIDEEGHPWVFATRVHAVDWARRLWAASWPQFFHACEVSQEPVSDG